MTDTDHRAPDALADADELGVRIPFGPRPNQSVPASWAAAALSWLHEQRPETFGEAMLHAMGVAGTVKAKRP